MTLRWRLTLTYAALLTLTLLLAGTVNYLGVKRTLYDTLDTSLRAAAQTAASVEAQPELEPTPDAGAALDIINNRHPVRLTFFDQRGRLADRGPSRVGFTPRTGSYHAGTERVFMQRVPSGWLQATQSDADLRASLRGILGQQLLGFPVVVLISLATGYALADRALRPVDRVSDTATRIAKSGHPGERVPQAPGSDELARLTTTITDMLSRLDAQLTHERLFAHASAHELRTPLSVIRAAASLSLEHERQPDQYRATLAQVQAVSEDMSALTDRLMALARAAHPAPTRPVNLADVALMVTELHTEEASARQIRLQVTADDAPTTGDFSALVLAAGNLVQNAVQHSPPGTTVQVTSGVQADQAFLTVQDAGPGIPAASVPRFLQPFQRGEHSRGGAGLGLALVQAVITAHGGEVTLVTPPLHGLRAQLTLPSSDA